MHQTGEEQDHIAALVHDGRVAVVAAHFAGQFVLDALLRRVVPLEVVVAVHEVYIVLVEDGGPLEGSGCEGILFSKLILRNMSIDILFSLRMGGGWAMLTMLRLTSSAMTQLRIQRLLTTELVLDLAAMAAGLVARLEVLIGLAQAVGRAVLPVVLALLRLALGFVGVHFGRGVGEEPEGLCRAGVGYFVGSGGGGLEARD